LTSLEKLELLQEERELEQEEWDQWWFTKQARSDEIDKCEARSGFSESKIEMAERGRSKSKIFSS
jgi:hypothetical protein